MRWLLRAALQLVGGTCAFGVLSAAGASLAGAAYYGELELEIDTRPDQVPHVVCLEASDEVSMPNDAAQTCDGGGADELRLRMKVERGPVSERAISVTKVSFRRHDRRLTVSYVSKQRPEVLTVITGGKDSRATDKYQRDQSDRWQPQLGARAVALPVVPRELEVDIEFPEYECLNGERAPSKRRVTIDKNWQIVQRERISGCQPKVGENEPHGAVAGAATFAFPPNTSVRSGNSVPVVPTGMMIAWQPDRLSEARQRDASVELEADRPLGCGMARWNEGKGRFEWECGDSNSLNAPQPVATLEFPVRLQMTVQQCEAKEAQCPSWGMMLRHPGQTMTGYVATDERTLLVKWSEWCTSQPGRADWSMDRINRVDLETGRGNSLSLTVPRCSGQPSEPTWTRMPLPGLQYGEQLRVSFVGDRTFHTLVAQVSQCSGHASSVPNCLELFPPEAESAATNGGSHPPVQKGNLRRDIATLGAGVFGGLYGAFVDDKEFLGPVSEVHLNILFRGFPRWAPGHTRWDANLGLTISYQTWSAYRCRGACSEDQEDERANRQRDSLLAFGLQPGLRLAAISNLFFGIHLLGRYGAAPIRIEGDEQVPTQLRLGGGLSLAWYLSRAVALELNADVASALTRFVTLDPSGLVSSLERGTVQSSLLAGLRFDDLAGD